MIPYDHFASRQDTPHRLQLPAASTARFRQRNPDVPATNRLVPAGHPRPPPETRPATALHPTAGTGTGRIPHPGVGRLRAIACGRVPRDIHRRRHLRGAVNPAGAFEISNAETRPPAAASGRTRRREALVTTRNRDAHPESVVV